MPEKKPRLTQERIAKMSAAQIAALDQDEVDRVMAQPPKPKRKREEGDDA